MLELARQDAPRVDSYSINNHMHSGMHACTRTRMNRIITVPRSACINVSSIAITQPMGSRHTACTNIQREHAMHVDHHMHAIYMEIPCMQLLHVLDRVHACMFAMPTIEGVRFVAIQCVHT